jgi:small-conductance mechanosensitive channel
MPISQLTITFWSNILWTINVLVWTFAAIKVLRVILERLSDEENSFTLIQPGTLPLFYNSVFVLVVVTGIYFLSKIWTIDVTTWLASAGVIGIAVGFAAKDTLANLFAGIFIFADAPYKIGDYIVLDNGDRGLVRHIGLRSTKLLTRDDVEITIPNSIISNSRIINQSGGPVERFRLRIQFSVAYGTEIDHVRKLTLAIASAEKLVLENPLPRLRFRRFEASGIAFELLCWVKLPALRGRVTDRLNEAVYNAFLKEGDEIPNNKQDIYIKEMLPVSSKRRRL